MIRILCITLSLLLVFAAASPVATAQSWDAAWEALKKGDRDGAIRALGQPPPPPPPQPLPHLKDGWDALKAGDTRGVLMAWIPLAEIGDPKALYALGWAFNVGQGALNNRPLARRYYAKAAGVGNADGAYALGLMIRDGVGGRTDYASAREWFTRAVQLAKPKFLPDAEYATGMLFYKGLGVPRDFAQATDWLDKAARHDHPAAQFLLATIYEQGWGTKVDRPLAFYWYSMAARHGQAKLDTYGTGMDVKTALARLSDKMILIEHQKAQRMLRAISKKFGGG